MLQHKTWKSAPIPQYSYAKQKEKLTKNENENETLIEKSDAMGDKMEFYLQNWSTFDGQQHDGLNWTQIFHIKRKASAKGSYFGNGLHPKPNNWAFT